MEFYVVGVNHRRAPVEMREWLAFDATALPEALATLRREAEIGEAVILSTCNRVELYLAQEDGRGDPLERSLKFLARRRGRAEEELRPILYRHEGREAVRHLLEVASSLDSMVLGETQIIAQVKQAYHVAKEAGHTGRVLNPLFQRALALAKKIHATTAIGERAVSVSSVAAKLAHKIFQDLTERTVLILGAGETGTLTLEALRERGARRAIVVNRTAETARTLAQKFGGEGHGLEDLPAVLPEADIVIACLSVKEPLLDLAHVQTALHARRREPMFFIDIGVPRNIRPEIDRLDNVYLFNIDDLEEIVNQNLLEREREVAAVAPMVEEETARLMGDLSALDVRGVLTRLRAQIEAVADEELARTLSKLASLPPEQRQEVEELVHRLVNKFLHAPTTSLKEEAGNGHLHPLTELAARLFNLK